MGASTIYAEDMYKLAKEKADERKKKLKEKMERECDFSWIEAQIYNKAYSGEFQLALSLDDIKNQSEWPEGASLEGCVSVYFKDRKFTVYDRNTALLFQWGI